jgi:light-harvesting complex II chlorophyll a/b binding protein 2
MRRTMKGKASSGSSSTWYGPDRPQFLGPFSEGSCPPYLQGVSSYKLHLPALSVA